MNNSAASKADRLRCECVDGVPAAGEERLLVGARQLCQSLYD